MKTQIGFADFTYFLAKFHLKTIDDPEILDRAAALKLQCFQASPAFHLPDGGKAQRQLLRAKAEKLGITLFAAGYGDASIPAIEKALAGAQEMGAKVLRYACGPMFCWKDPVPLPQFAKVMAKAAKLAEAAGIPIAIENHQDYTSEELAGVLKKLNSRWVGVWFDTGNSLALLEDPVFTAKTLAPYVMGIHLKEYVVFPAAGGFDLVGVPLGEGIVDNPSVLKILKQKFKGDTFYVAIENPLERCYIPALSPKYVAKFAKRPIKDFGVIANFIEASKQKYPDGIKLPHEAGLTDKQILAAEQKNNELAVAYARKLCKA